MGAVGKVFLLSLTGATAATLAAPAIGTAIGVHVLGLSGAAATSAGLAAAGGGSLASGGLGMAGGSAILSASGTAAGAATVANRRLRRFLTGLNPSINVELLKTFTLTAVFRSLPGYQADYEQGVSLFAQMEKELARDLENVRQDEKSRKETAVVKDRHKAVSALVRYLR